MDPTERRRSYLGDVTALVAYSAASGGGSRLCIGSGGVITTCHTGTLERTKVRVFGNGARVHGVAVSEEEAGGGGGRYLIAHGEQYAKVYRLDAGEELFCLARIGPLAHWIMDAVFLPRAAGSGALVRVALGLSDNSVVVVDVGEGSAETCGKFVCSRSYLLYSMKIFCSRGEGLVYAAAGTIFNSVLVWVFPLPGAGGRQDKEVISCFPRLNFVGHQGSILKLCWSGSGDMLASCSDDRTARVWSLASLKMDAAKRASKECETLEAEKVIYGHGSRLWDCLFSGDSEMLVTASEDCTCKFWLSKARKCETDTSDLVTTLCGHQGRGVWRIAAAGGYLFTAGADGAVKRWLLQHCCNPSGIATTSLPSMHVRSFQQALPPLPRGHKDPGTAGASSAPGKKEEKSAKDWVRCLKLAGVDTMYVATNQGMLYENSVRSSSWRSLFANPRRMPLLCIEVMRPRGGRGVLSDHFICAGDVNGYFTMIAVSKTCCGPWLEWKAHEKRLMGIFLGRQDEENQVFSTDVSGEVKWWIVPCKDMLDGKVKQEPALKAKMRSPFKMRILGVDFCRASMLVICGDKNGSIMAFRYHGGSTSSEEPLDLTILMQHKHNVSPVSFLRSRGNDEVVSGGGDGKLYTYKVIPSSRKEGEPGHEALCQVGIHIEKRIAAIEEQVEMGDGATYIGGFQSSDFLVWNVTENCEVIKISCGGWKRPHSLYMGEEGASFAHVRDHVIHVQQLEPRDKSAQVLHSAFSNALTPSFHGQEIHSTIIVPTRCLGKGDGAPPCLVITGAEDGYVRYSEWEPDCATAGHFKLCASGIIGECVAGAQVRSLSYSGHKEAQGAYVTAVGAKEVVMVWKIVYNSSSEEEGCLQCELISTKEPKGGLRPKMKKVSAKDQVTDLRHLAVDTFVYKVDGSTDVIFMLVSSADASVKVTALQVDRRTGSTKWHNKVCDLVNGSRNPTLSIRWKEIESLGTSVAFTGSTDGAICCWDTSMAINSFKNALAKGEDHQCIEISPLKKFQGVHASGVNSLALKVSASEGLGQLQARVVSGGDDQALHAKEVRFRVLDGSSGGVAMTSDRGAHVANSHYSALRSVWTDGTFVLSTGLDQRLNISRLFDDEKQVLRLELLSRMAVEAGETEALSAFMDEDLCYVALAGRGLSIMQVALSSRGPPKNL
ncbi:WD40 repeat domain-containing protein [Chloropicon primus]|uniref:WD40 repeat domain-containing protein n=2 Tax=Chloropicon primus TaxID=1764295 RepID=A0A5B8MPC7_9CHLO|nr:WD40 repeat domain-containing protein [Chloropicon primus]UPR01542.1 WD40 repeat domain-containing protein [Chloropicon primus]|eukprot:QDZ22326.1 WD40 repeat domain-containing protein [Chloropicon primus]